MDLYDEDNMLMLSGIQHYMFCPRQWALIHIEQQWAENKLTVEGNILLRKRQYHLSEDAQFVILRNTLKCIIDGKTDSIRFYFLGKNWQRRVEHIGKKTSFDMTDELII